MEPSETELCRPQCPRELAWRRNHRLLLLAKTFTALHELGVWRLFRNPRRLHLQQWTDRPQM